MTGHFKLDSGGAANANHLADGAANANHLAGTGISTRGDDGSCRNSSNLAELGAIKEANANHLAGTADINIIRTDDGPSVVASDARHAFENGSNMADLRAIKEGTAEIIRTDGSFVVASDAKQFRTDDGSFVIASDARHTFQNGSNMVEYGAIKEGTGGNTTTDDGSSLIVAYASKNGSNMVEYGAIKEGIGGNTRIDDGSLIVASRHPLENGINMAELGAITEGFYSGCIVEELPTMRLDVVSGENEKRSGKITLDLSRKVEKGIISGEIRRLENMATSIQLQNRLEILKNERVQGTMESLPSDILLDIVSRVPAETVLECKLICQRWGTLFRGSNFTNMHLSRQLNHLLGDDDDGDDNITTKMESCLFFACRTDNPDEFTSLLFHGGQLSTDRISIDGKYIYSENLKRIYHPPMHHEPLFNHLVGSSNGLVCAFQHHHRVIDPIYICNPLTREYVYLPKLVVKKEDVHPDRIQGGEVNLYFYTACGFGYVRSTNEYKVVRIHYLGFDKGNVEVYTLGSGCGWRNIGNVSHLLNTSAGGRGTYANDSIYWTSGKKVVAFDLVDEKFRSLSVPPMENRQRKDICGVVTLGRHLCFYMDNKLSVKIWSLIKSSNSKESWCMMFDIDYEAVLGSRKRKFQPIKLTKNGEVILLYAESVLYSYDTKTSFLKMISNEPSTNYFEAVEVIAHVNTFASLEAVGENSRRYTVRPHRIRTPWDDVIDELDRVSLGEELDATRFRLR